MAEKDIIILIACMAVGILGVTVAMAGINYWREKWPVWKRWTMDAAPILGLFLVTALFILFIYKIEKNRRDPFITTQADRILFLEMRVGDLEDELEAIKRNVDSVESDQFELRNEIEYLK